MITPLFEVSQNENQVILVMRVPYIKTSTMDYYILGQEFKFYAKPYYLRLTFSHPLAEDGTEKAVYDIQKGELTIHLPKKTKGTLLHSGPQNIHNLTRRTGQFFENLGMLTQLLAKKKDTQPQRPLIEVVNGHTPEDTG